MSRVYIAVPVAEEQAAEALGQALSGYRECGKEAAALGYTGPPRIVRLSDRTEPTLTKRVEILEEQSKQRSANVAVMFHDVRWGAEHDGRFLWILLTSGSCGAYAFNHACVHR